MKQIEKWENQTIKITNQFLLDYFDDNNPDYFYIGDEIGGVFNYGDYFFDFSNVLICYKLGVTKEQLFQWYDFCLENQSTNISLDRYILNPQDKKEQEEKYLEELKERVKAAKKEFKKAIKNYNEV